jgi:hypothetical protein
MLARRPLHPPHSFHHGRCLSRVHFFVRFRFAQRDQRARLERGEDVPGGFGKPVTHDDLVGILLGASWSKSDMRRSVQVHKLSEVGAFEELMEETHKRREQSEKAAVRAVWRRRVAD